MSEPAKDEAELIVKMINEIKKIYTPSLTIYGVALICISAIRQAGWAVVPVEPTEEMLNGFSEPNGYICSLDWEAILAASPMPPGVKP
jgi:hypothetical protein